MSRNIDIRFINLPGMFKRLSKKLIGIAGYQIAPPVQAGEFPELTYAMRRLRRSGSAEGAATRSVSNQVDSLTLRLFTQPFRYCL
jgi:hypothetical protein